jgi:hypothetical protein
METAKVDLRKLQLLNDRIAQVIEALNQVRFSVHGLQHTPGFGSQMSGGQPWNNGSTWGWSWPNGSQAWSQYGHPNGPQAWSQPWSSIPQGYPQSFSAGFPQQQQWYGSPYFSPQQFIGTSPWSMGPQQFISPMGVPPGQPMAGVPQHIAGVPQPGVTAPVVGAPGLSHTAADVAEAAAVAARVAQPMPVAGAFPYAQAVQYGQTFPWAWAPVAPVPVY